MTPNDDELCQTIEALAPSFLAMSERIWEFAELRFEETRSAAAQMALLEEQGFVVERGVAGIPTAFVATRGTGGPVLAFLGEFDALNGMSQVAGATAPAAVTPGGNGHGCGHNLLGAGSMLAAAGLSDWMARSGTAGTVKYFGCPAEEGGSGKTFMVRAGAFDGIDAALTWHPAPYTGVRSTENLATMQAKFRFAGRSAHAALAPQNGRSALDAVELMNVGANFMREHIPSECRISYAITDPGSRATNVVPAHAEVLYCVRAPDGGEARELFDWVVDAARGAALMTQTTVTVEFDRAASPLVPNNAIETRMNEHLVRLGPVPASADDVAFARTIRATLSDAEVRTNLRTFRASSVDPAQAVHGDILPFSGQSHFRASSTDVGDVSSVMPTAQCWTSCWAVGTPGHSWQVVAQGKSGLAHKGLVHAAKLLALTGLDLLRDDALRGAAWAELRRRMQNRPYVCPIPDDVLPPPARSETA